MFKKTINIILLILFITSCSDTVGSVKRGLTGAKSNAADEFLVKKKDPLILPPDFENLPTPDERTEILEEASSFEKSIEISIENDSTESSSVEESVLKKIRSK